MYDERHNVVKEAVVLFELIDKLAGKWFDWRMTTDPEVKRTYEEFGLKTFEVKDGFFEATYVTPVAAFIAGEFAAMLNAANAKNYIEFDMMPRLDRGMRPIRVTIQWANGISPADKAAQLAERVRVLENKLEELGVSI